MEVVRIGDESTFQLRQSTMILGPLFRTRLYCERFVVLKLCYIRSVDDVRDSRVADIIVGYSSLITTESNPRTSYMEAGRNKLELHLLNFDPPVISTGGHDCICKILSVG